jgi:hypothetical protein
MVATKAAMPPKAMIACHEVSTGANHSRKKQQARKKADPAHWMGFRPTTSTATIISTVCAQKTRVSIGIQRNSNNAMAAWRSGPATPCHWYPAWKEAAIAGLAAAGLLSFFIAPSVLTSSPGRRHPLRHSR